MFNACVVVVNRRPVLHYRVVYILFWYAENMDCVLFTL